MSAKRQPSTTSLSKYARANSPGLANRSLDFCNSFWGLGDGGVDVLFARMRGAARTMEELKNFWKERSAIEEEYAKRLAKLAKIPLGKDEIGEMRNSLDTLRLETDKQAGYHMHVAQTIRADLEGQASTFYLKQLHHKKAYQAVIEKEFRAKQTQESYVNKAREKYEADCLRINSYTAQSTLVQGKDLEKIHLKLERAQQTVQANERDFANFAKALQDTVFRWEQDWKAFCDSCQDLEQDRLEFMKDNMWAYANAVSTVCVSDDESCEKMRLALEQMEPEKDMENFTRDYGTGNLIPDPPAFVNYTAPDALPSSSTRPTTRPAQFERSTQRDKIIPPAQEEEVGNAVNMAGLGASGTRKGEMQPEAPIQRSGTVRSQTRGRTISQSQINGHTSGQSTSRRPTLTSDPPQPSTFRPAQDPNAEPIDPTSDTYMKIGSAAYKVDLSKDPQQQGSSRAGPSTTQGGTQGRKEVDPLAKQMHDLKTAASIRTRSQSRQGTADSIGPGPSTSANASKPTNYHNSAEAVVGQHPSASRPTSPNPPTAQFMAPPAQRSSGPDTVESVLNDYHQSLPGEGKSPSRRGSFIGSSGPTPAATTQGQPQNLARPISPGIGAHGRTTSPQPISRSASPSRGNYMTPPANTAAARTTSPANKTGIVLGSDGSVEVDVMLDRYQQNRPPPQQQNSTRRLSYVAGANGMTPAPPAHSAGYGVPPAPPAGYMVQQPNYVQPPPSQPYYVPPPPPPHQAPAPQQVYQPQPQTGPYPGMDNSHRGPAVAAPYFPPNSNTHMQPPPQNYNGYSTGHNRSPSPGPPPTGQTTEDGRGILFYVKALYDYNATIEEEFDFQAGDIIAVTATPEDGWWSGELLDEARRQPGRHVFPSNFVCLF